MTIKISTLEKAYKTFWHTYQATARSAGGLVKPNDGNIAFKIDSDRTDNSCVAITALCHFPAWPFRSSSSKERVDISVRSLEIYSRSDEKLQKSNVQVLYSRTLNKEAHTLLAIHYDYEHPAQAAHPVFHAQFGEGIKAADLKSFGFASKLNPPPSGTLYSSVRIPTPCMNFGSVVLGLAADHLGADAYASILKMAQQAELLKWQANCDDLQRSFGNNVYLPSYHWYA